MPPKSEAKPVSSRKRVVRRRSWRHWFRIVKYVFSGKWLSSLSSIDRTLSRKQKSVVKTIVPKRVREWAESVREKVKRAEKKVAKTGKKVTKTVSESAVGESAKELARRGKNFESKAGKFLLRSLAELISQIVPEPVQKVFKAFGKSFWRTFGVFFVFAGRWFKTRQYWHLLAGVPAFMLAMPLAYCMVRIPFYGNDAKAQHYRNAVTKALEEDDLDSADLYYRKLSQLGAVNARVQFMNAEKLFEKGDEEGAIAIMQQLAPTQELNFAPAHNWLAYVYLRREVEARSAGGARRSRADNDSENMRLARIHIDLVAERYPSNPDLKSNQVQYSILTGDLKQAESGLLSLTRVKSGRSSLALANIYALQGRWQDAEKQIRNIIEPLERRAGSGKLTSGDFQTWSDCWVLLGRIDTAIEKLEAGLAAHPDDEDLADRLFELLLARYAALNAAGGSETERLQLARRAWEIKKSDPDPIILINELARLSSPTGQAARELAEEIVKSESENAAAFAIFGVMKATQGQYDEAAQYLRRACEIDTTDAQAANNLAWVLLQLRPAPLEEANRLSARAIELDPDRATFRETRGQVLLAQRDYQAAIEEFQRALNGIANAKEIHSALATAYEALGERQLAELHRQISRTPGR